jgi:spore photoproduct lyase
MSSSAVISLASYAQKKKARDGRAVLPFLPEHVCVDRAVMQKPSAIRILNAVKGATVDIVDDVRLLKHPRDLSVAKRTLLLTSHRGEAFKGCQGMGAGHLCCGYLTLDLISGCPMECSYCILQSYLANNPVTTAYVNTDEILAQVGEFLDRYPNRFFRIGTGELSDSLALDPIVDNARVLIPFFARRRNAILELKTKTDFVDHLLELEHGGRTVFAWSVNTPEIIAAEERGTASLDERLAAARKAAAAGYGVAFHFDPIVMRSTVEETVEVYRAIVDRILDEISNDAIAWVSLGLLRYPPELAEVARKRFPETRIFDGELVPVGGKMRYPRFLRQEVYRPLWERLASEIPERKLYLCMETPAVWQRIDPSISTSGGIEKRLCHTESICSES